MADERITDAELATLADYLKTLSSIRDIRRELAEYSKEELDTIRGSWDCWFNLQMQWRNKKNLLMPLLHL